MTAQQLKNSILQMAVQGKLVPQDPNDEPASVLLERIRAEKELLIKQKKIKKEKSPSYIFRGADNIPYEKIGDQVRSLGDEVPFDIPDSWEWVRLGEIYQHNTGKALNVSNRSGELLTYITTSNLYWNRFEIDSLREMYFSESEIEKCTVTKGDLLVCEGGDIGRAAIWPYDTDIRIQNHIHRLRSYSKICTEYYYYIFFLYKHAGWIGGKGIGIQGLSSNALHALLFPLPPLSEQHRIVTKIKEFEPFFDQYTQAEQRLNNLNTQFPDLLKKSILQEAVQGKLVPQDPADEPASVLLERIRAEKEQLIKAGKIKRDKHESVIFRRDNSHYEKLDGIERCIDDEMPFDIPPGWQWIRLHQLCISITDGDHQPPPQVPTGIPFLVISNVSSGQIDFSNTRFVPENYFESLQWNRIPSMGDLLFTVTGSYGIVLPVNTTERFCFQRHIALIKPIAVSADFLSLWLSSPLAHDQCREKATGTAQKTVGLNTLRDLLIPLPPHQEQIRIVEKLYQILPHIQSLTRR